VQAGQGSTVNVDRGQPSKVVAFSDLFLLRMREAIEPRV
jgi:hypothetical protein